MIFDGSTGGRWLASMAWNLRPSAATSSSSSTWVFSGDPLTRILLNSVTTETLTIPSGLDDTDADCQLRRVGIIHTHSNGMREEDHPVLEHHHAIDDHIRADLVH